MTQPVLPAGPDHLPGPINLRAINEALSGGADHLSLSVDVSAERRLGPTQPDSLDEVSAGGPLSAPAPR